MALALLGLSHQTASVDFRERVALDQHGAVRLLNRLRETPGIEESLVISTCNRTEIYAVAQDDLDILEPMAALLADQTGVHREELDAHVYRRADRDVVHHLFMVASGLDSMVVGENQILGQVKEAYSNAVTTRAKGPLVDALMHRAFMLGKQVRTQTGLGRGRLSVAGVACELAEKIFHDLSTRKVLLVGAGETGELVITHLKEHGVTDITVTNRTLVRAEELSVRFGGRAVPFDGLWDAVGQAEILITSTAAAEPVITAEPLRRALGRRATPLFIIDIAVPRDVAADVDDLADVFLYDIDALQTVVRETIDKRRGEVHRARAMVAEATDRFVDWQRSQAVTPTIVQVREQFEAIRHDEIEKLKGQMTAADFEVVDRATRAIINKLLHHPTVHIKQAAKKPDSGPVLQAFRLLLGLDDERR